MDFSKFLSLDWFASMLLYKNKVNFEIKIDLSCVLYKGF